MAALKQLDWLSVTGVFPKLPIWACAAQQGRDVGFPEQIGDVSKEIEIAKK